MVLATVVGILLVLASTVGLLDAAYFVGVAYRLFPPDARWIPQACQMDEQTCAAIVDTSYGRALGLPNAVYGILWYAIVLAPAVWLITRGAIPACQIFLLAAAGTVLFSVYLVWALVQQLEVDCPLCYLGHGLNLSILVLLTIGCLL